MNTMNASKIVSLFLRIIFNAQAHFSIEVFMFAFLFQEHHGEVGEWLKPHVC